MTAQMDNYKQDGHSSADLIGQEWQKLLEMIEGRPGDIEAKMYDGGSQRPYKADENVLRTLQDVKRLRQKDMPLFGHCPETDVFYTVVCSMCSMILMPHALKDHCEKRHGESGEKPHSSLEKSSIDSPNKTKSKKAPPAKIEKTDKMKKIKPSSTPSPALEVAEDMLKDPKRTDKSKKPKPVERTVPPPELEPMIPNAPPSRSEKRKQKLVTNPCVVNCVVPELQPIVALSPIQVAEKAIEANEVKELPKKTKKDKKKNERKADKVFDPNKHCGVINDNGKPCVRSILCKVHQVALKRAVPNRSMPYDMLTRILKTQNDEEKSKVENGVVRPKVEPMEKPIQDIKDTQLGSCMVTVQTANGAAVKPWTQSDQVSIKTEEPPCKRLKIKEEEIVEEESDPGPFALPSDLDALIEETLKDVEENEPLPVIPLVPKPEPLVKWNLEMQLPRTSPSPPPPHIILDDIHWHSSHPKPLATNTFGCRLIGGLMSTCKKLDTLRKHLQSVWTSSSSSSSATPIRSGFNDLYGTNNTQNPNTSNPNIKNSFNNSKYAKKPNQNKTTMVKKNVPSPLTKGTSVKRKRKTSGNIISPVQNTTSNASDIISGLLISNPVPIQRTGPATVPTIPTGVIPVNSITGNGVPLRLFQGSLPVIASTAPNQPATFIQLNLCPPK